MHHEISVPPSLRISGQPCNAPATSPTTIARRPTAPRSSSAAIRSKRSRLRCLTRSPARARAARRSETSKSPSSAVASPSVRSSSHAATTFCTVSTWAGRAALPPCDRHLQGAQAPPKLLLGESRAATGNDDDVARAHSHEHNRTVIDAGRPEDRNWTGVFNPPSTARFRAFLAAVRAMVAHAGSGSN